MEKEEIITEKSITIAEYTIVPIIRRSLYCHKNKEGNIVIGTKQPLAVLVTTDSKIKLFMIEENISMEQLIEELPELKNLL